MQASGERVRAVCLMGPTASGKTELAMAMSSEFPLELISVDSAQLYRGMDIGTAKPAPAILAEYPHHLIDIREPADAYSAGEFCRDVVPLMQAAHAAGRTPLLVGGTMLYFQALQRGLAVLPEADEELRAEIDARAHREGWPALHAELQKLDPQTAARLQLTDAQRIQRALEVCRLAGEPMSALLDSTRPPLDADYLNLGLMPADRAALHARIERRLDAMVEEGLVAEVRALLAQPDVDAESPAMRAVGYRQFARYVAGNCSFEDAREQAVVATRRLAKRQLTWLRSWPDLHVLDSVSGDCSRELREILKDWLNTGARS